MKDRMKKYTVCEHKYLEPSDVYAMYADLVAAVKLIEEMLDLARLIAMPYTGDPEDPSWGDIQDRAHDFRAKANAFLGGE